MNIDIFGTTIPLPNLGMIVFAQLAGLGILSGIMMITRRDAVHSVLWLVVAFFSLAGMYVMLGAEFLAALQVLVYTGAILVLFLFVIMLLGLRESGAPKLSGIHRAQLFAAWPIGIILALEIITVVLFTDTTPRPESLGEFSTAQVAAMGGNVQALGRTLYVDFLFPFEVASLILLLAVIGAIVLARKEEPAEVEEILPSLGISLGRRSVANSPQEEQIEKKLLPALGISYAPDARAEDVEIPTVDQPTAIGEGTTSGLEIDEDKVAGAKT